MPNGIHLAACAEALAVDSNSADEESDDERMYAGLPAMIRANLPRHRVWGAAYEGRELNWRIPNFSMPVASDTEDESEDGLAPMITADSWLEKQSETEEHPSVP